MEVDALLAGLGAVVTAATGLILMLHEIRKDAADDAKEKMDKLRDEVRHADEAYIEQRQYNYTLRQRIADQGDLPPPPLSLHELAIKARRGELP